jgi:hypothetical protein
VGTQHFGVPGGGAAGAASSSHFSLAPPGSAPGGWAASLGGASGAVVQSQTGSALPSGSAASAGTPSTRRSVQDLGIEHLISQEDFDSVVTAVKVQGSTMHALRSVGREDIPPASMWKWLRGSGALEQFRQ